MSCIRRTVTIFQSPFRAGGVLDRSPISWRCTATCDYQRVPVFPSVGRSLILRLQSSQSTILGSLSAFRVSVVACTQSSTVAYRQYVDRVCIHLRIDPHICGHALGQIPGPVLSLAHVRPCRCVPSLRLRISISTAYLPLYPPL